MSEEIKANVTMDLKACARFRRQSKSAKKMKIGEILEAETTDPGAHADFPAWAKSTGNEIVKIDKGASSTKFYIKKLK